MDRCPDSFQMPPKWVINASTGLLFVTVPSSFYTIFLIYSSTPPNTDKQYKILLLIYQTSVTAYSVMNSLAGYVQYMPSFTIVEAGLFGINSVWSVFGDISSQIIITSAAEMILLRRFSLAVYGRDRKLKIQFLGVFMFFISCGPFTAVCIFFCSIYDHEHAKTNLVNDCPHLKPLADSYDVLYTNDIRITDYSLYAVFFATNFVILVYVVYFAVFLRAFNKRSRSFSKATRRLQFRLIVSSTLMIIIPCLAHGVPSFGTQIILFFRIRAELWLSAFFWAFGSLHCLLNSITFILLNEHYLTKFKKDYRAVYSAIRTAAFKCW